ncbi:MAG: hypothetical protein FWF05_06610 [Oscillospiraceae bacterium]|nr:hypothetical protein [Oscillospiraceae bacterium]
MAYNNRQPEFKQLLKVLEGGIPDRDVLFELFMGDQVYEHVVGPLPKDNPLDWTRAMIKAFSSLGYDYATVNGSNYCFPRKNNYHGAQTISLNESPVITDRASFAAYQWQDPKAADYSRLRDIGPDLPGGMKLMVMGPGGVLENVIRLVGYDNLCFMLYDDEQLLWDIFERVGSGLVEYYRRSMEYDSVGLLMSNDDWGFKSQTMISPKAMRKYVFPWHREIVKAAHAAGKPAVLHSCGWFEGIVDDIIGMGYDGRHSYEDTIMPVERAYELLAGKMAVLGGIDLHFLCSATPERIRERSRNMLDRAGQRGGYALGSGNSIPGYCPIDSYLAMISVVDGRI